MQITACRYMHAEEMDSLEISCHVHVHVHNNYIYVHVCSVTETRQSRATTPKDNSSFFPREKEELPEAGFDILHTR